MKIFHGYFKDKLNWAVCYDIFTLLEDSSLTVETKYFKNTNMLLKAYFSDLSSKGLLIPLRSNFLKKSCTEGSWNLWSRPSSNKWFKEKIHERESKKQCIGIPKVLVLKNSKPSCTQILTQSSSVQSKIRRISIAENIVLNNRVLWSKIASIYIKFYISRST